MSKPGLSKVARVTLTAFHLAVLALSGAAVHYSRAGDVAGYLVCGGLAVYTLIWCERVLPARMAGHWENTVEWVLGE